MKQTSSEQQTCDNNNNNNNIACSIIIPNCNRNLVARDLNACTWTRERLFLLFSCPAAGLASSSRSKSRSGKTNLITLPSSLSLTLSLLLALYTREQTLAAGLNQVRRQKRSTRQQQQQSASLAPASTRILAVSGRPVELQCPLANELRALTGSTSSSSASTSANLFQASSTLSPPDSQQQQTSSSQASSSSPPTTTTTTQPQHSIIWRKSEYFLSARCDNKHVCRSCVFSG